MFENDQRDIRGALARIRSVYSSLAPAERKVADVILEQYEKAIYLSVTQLAETSGVGESTVIRFCQNAGFRGYQELKLVLARDLVDPSENLSEGVSVDDTLESIVRKVGYTNSRSIDDTIKLLDIRALDMAVNWLLDARRIQFYGVGQSGVTALDAKYRFMRLGLICDALTDSHVQMMSAATLDSRDLAVGISFSGSTIDVVEAIDKAKERGARTMCITAYARSPLAKASDIKLIAASSETPLGSGSLRSKITQLLVLDLLYTVAALRLGDKGRLYTELVAESVLHKLY
ncbi:MAG: MurR/RpiR family transcriptional regulator [Limnochordia bacterium]|jgi:DNA-binding MurR/RpiR family transcriptional regulator|nr:MAG: transcriptional regulator [Peptococcaceae bacterium 1109]